jgi:O-antigen ligase
MLIWLPMALACIHAVAPAHSLHTVLPYFLLLPASYYALRCCADDEVLRLVTLGAAALVLFAALDACIQLLFQRDLFGYPLKRQIVMGVFYPQQRLGLFLGVFAPLCLDVILVHVRRTSVRVLLVLPLLIAITLSLKRAAWLMLVLGLCAYVRLPRAAARVPRALPWRYGMAALLLALSLAFTYPAFKARLLETAGLFSANFSEIDRASGYRLSLWRTGAAMFRSHPLLGIGPRGYRHVYRQYAPPDDFWLARTGTGQTHPHLLLLEVAVECGLLGLCGFALAYALMLNTLRRQTRNGRPGVWLLCAVIAWLPINAHLAFYAAYWSTLVWLLLGIGLGAMAPGVATAGSAAEQNRQLLASGRPQPQLKMV